MSDICTCKNQLQPHDRMKGICPPLLPSRPDPNAVEVKHGTWLHHGLYLRGAKNGY